MSLTATRCHHGTQTQRPCVACQGFPPRNYIVPEDPTVHARFHGAPPGTVIVAPHWAYDPHVLEDVTFEMKQRQRCLIRAVPDGEVWHAVEGSHRIHVASALGITLDVQAIAPDHLIQHDGWPNGIVTAAYLIAPERPGRGVARYRVA